VELQPVGETAEVVTPSPDAALDDVVRCRACRHELTTRGAAISVDGAHTHTFRNPDGWSFLVACFREAPGVAADGPLTGEATWFAGYRWRFALCGGCGGQLGWWYVSGSTFVGLIATRIA